MDGLLLVDKPSGWTSFDVVAKVRSYLRSPANPKPKVGHTGTLDPLATGLLVLTIGNYCKRATEFTKLDKTYEVTMTLGATSTTGDSEGLITQRLESGSIKLPEAEIVKVLKQFKGEIEQTPPAYSAIKVNGQRAYKLARAGQKIKLEPRGVKVYSNILKKVKMPEVFFQTTVSSGTYVRSLVEDMGEALGTGAYMSGLRRVTVGHFDLQQAADPTSLTAEVIRKRLLTK